MRARLSPGHWLWTCRAGFGEHLAEELASVHPVTLGPSLVESARCPASPPAFARMGFELLRVVGPGDALPSAVQALVERTGNRPLCLQAWPADEGAALSAQGGAFAQALAAQLPEGRLLPSERRAQDAGGFLVQLCELRPGTMAVGLVEARGALSLSPGGRHRMRREREAPSRASLKIEEALESLPFGPEAHDLCVDLGAAPGGWSQRLLSRGARVIAVDPGRMDPALASHKRLFHLRASAFDFVPDEPADWLFCDMAWRPLEVGQLLAKWARRRWARHLVANIKLPMKEKVATLTRVRATLEQGGWKLSLVRQLYHDRDEVTVAGHRR